MTNDPTQNKIFPRIFLQIRKIPIFTVVTIFLEEHAGDNQENLIEHP